MTRESERGQHATVSLFASSPFQLGPEFILDCAQSRFPRPLLRLDPSQKPDFWPYQLIVTAPVD